MSPRTADIFLHTIHTHKLDKYVSSMLLFTLSEAVAEKCKKLKCKIYVAETPTQHNLIREVAKYLV